MKNNDLRWRVVAVVTSILLHSLAALSFADHRMSADVEKPNLPKVTHVRLNFPSPVTPPPPEPVAKNKPDPKPKPVAPTAVRG